MIRRPPRSPLFPYTPLSRSRLDHRTKSVPQPGKFTNHHNLFRRQARNDHPHATPDRVRHSVECTQRKRVPSRSEEHTSELQSQSNLVCRLLLEKKHTASTDT